MPKDIRRSFFRHSPSLDRVVRGAGSCTTAVRRIRGGSPAMEIAEIGRAHV